jgi:hypothetical protein
MLQAVLCNPGQYKIALLLQGKAADNVYGANL